MCRERPRVRARDKGTTHLLDTRMPDSSFNHFPKALNAAPARCGPSRSAFCGGRKGDAWGGQERHMGGAKQAAARVTGRALRSHTKPLTVT